MNRTVAVVGTGRMGAAMARRIAAAGHPLIVSNRTRARAAELAADLDAEVADSAAEAVGAAQVVVVSLADDAAADAVYGGPEGIIAGVGDEVVIVDTSTLAPATVRRLAPDVESAGGWLLDAPVSGSVATVDAGQLTVMVGGQPEALQAARPVIDSFAASVFHLGAQGTGAAMKLAVNSILHALNVALSEGLVLAERAGIDRAVAYEVIASGAAAAPFVHYKRDAFLDPDDQPVAFSLDLVAKDLDLIADLAHALGVSTTQLAANRQIVERAVREGLAQRDMSALAAMLRADGGT